ncbi:adenylosuccinate synthetase-like [Saccostrea cucullata]|uniref:adenylosuccinate synthetase-like n=1 Tax=Saccostrea cuccullata TaxID=36930 RepID=UPI002ED5317F
MALPVNGCVPLKKPRLAPTNPVTVVLGSQWGDEGKGKIVDMIAASADICCRCQVCISVFLHVFIILCTICFQEFIMDMNIYLIIFSLGNGVVVHLPNLFEEIEKNAEKGMEGWQDRLLISNRAHLVFDVHQMVDGLDTEMKLCIDLMPDISVIGTTKKGIGPAYSSKATRNGLRVGDLVGDFSLFTEKFRKLIDYYKSHHHDLEVDVNKELERYKILRNKVKPFVRDTIPILSKAIKDGKTILVEGAQSNVLDIDFGLYPYVTSSNCSIGGVCTGLGIPPHCLGDIVGVVKAYLTRVGSGGFPTELNNEVGEKLVNIGHEYGLHSLAITKLDVLDDFDEVKIGVAYELDGEKNYDSFPALDEDLCRVKVEYLTLPGWKQTTAEARNFSDLPQNAQNYIHKVEELVGVPVKWIGVGQSRDSVIEVS